MLPRSRLARLIWAASAVLLASATSVLAVRGARKPYAPSAPGYREQGPAGARVTVVEYSDFQCPACRLAVSPMKGLLALYGPELRLIYKLFPLTKAHERALPAARAAECAGQQGRFWDFHDLLYDKQAEWTPDASGRIFESYAKKLGMDLPTFQTCLKDPSVEALVTRDMREGNDHWVVSTPTFFINGKRFVGARQLSERGTIWVDQILKKK